jgi:hypothetical protein
VLPARMQKKGAIQKRKKAATGMRLVATSFV